MQIFEPKAVGLIFPPRDKAESFMVLDDGIDPPYEAFCLRREIGEPGIVQKKGFHPVQVIGVPHLDPGINKSSHWDGIFSSGRQARFFTRSLTAMDKPQEQY